MNKLLSELLPLHKFNKETIPSGCVLHHFGVIDSTIHDIDRPIWVSDSFECASQYRKFGVPAPRYTKLFTSTAFCIINMNGIRLQPIAAELKIYDHRDWNQYLAEYFIENDVLGMVYSGREIFLPEPNKVIVDFESEPC